MVSTQTEPPTPVQFPRAGEPSNKSQETTNALPYDYLTNKATGSRGERAENWRKQLKSAKTCQTSSPAHLAFHAPLLSWPNCTGRLRWLEWLSPSMHSTSSGLKCRKCVLQLARGVPFRSITTMSFLVNPGAPYARPLGHGSCDCKPGA
jgi:hypothetical protein